MALSANIKSIPRVESTQRPIAVFDSGAGGLTVLHELLVALPQENFLYFADTKNFPYGEKTVLQLQQFAQAIIEELLRREVKLIVIACNSATAAAADTVRIHLVRAAQRANHGPVPLVTVIEPKYSLLLRQRRISELAYLQHRQLSIAVLMKRLSITLTQRLTLSRLHALISQQLSNMNCR